MIHSNADFQYIIKRSFYCDKYGYYPGLNNEGRRAKARGIISFHTFKGTGGLHENFSEIDFLVVPDYRGDRSDAFGPMKKLLFLAEIIATYRSVLQ